MDLLDILLRQVDRNAVLSAEEKLLVCQKLSNADRNTAITIFKLIKNYKIKFDKAVKIGENPSNLPYFGQYMADIGIIFTATAFPEILMSILKIFIEDVEPNPKYEGDIETLMITLSGIKPDEKEDTPQVAQKFQIKGKKRGMKIENVTDHSGYKVMIGYMGDTNFNPDCKGHHCYWDGQPFDTRPICIPYKYEYKNNIHEFYGPKKFCSIFCMYAYLLEQSEKIHQLRDTRLEKALQLTMLAFKIMFPNENVLKPAPSRDVIDIYGGTKSLDDYRKQDYNKTYYTSGNVFFNEVQSADYIF